MQKNRQCKPYFIIHVISCLQANKLHKGRVQQIEAALKKIEDKKVDKDKAAKIIENLIQDGVLISDNKDNGILRLAGDSEITTYNQDLYCFECFQPGELVKCRDCKRAFHQRCARKHPERPNYIIQKSNQIAEFDDDDYEGASNRMPEIRDARTKRCRVVLQRARLVSDRSIQANEFIAENAASDEKPEVVCVGEVRPPTRQRNVTENSTMKCDYEADESADFEKAYCTYCRLMKAGQNIQPPNLNAAEMCHLLNCSFKRHRLWLKQDISKKLKNMKLTKKSIVLLLQYLLPNRPLMTLESIEEKIKYNKYTLFNELLADITEFQYALGVLFCSDCEDFDRSKYLFRDIQYDIQEIRRCPDCYRHSNDRLTPYWFALPCLQRHELVLAKCTGHPYWPAKVVRVLRTAGKYDVRFFGANHERAVVNKDLIRPIDAVDIPSKPKSAAFKKAMNELMCYQLLAARSSLEKFSFHAANRIEINNIISDVMRLIDVNSIVGERINKRRQTIAGTNITRVDLLSQLPAFISEENSLNFESLNSEEPRTTTPKSRRKPNMNATTIPRKRLRHAAIPIIELSSPTANSVTATNNTADEAIVMLRLENEDLKRKIVDLKRKTEHHEAELKIAKRKSYCFICLKQAEFVCCVNASYCSKKCQGQHWIQGHKNHCSHAPSNGAAFNIFKR